MKKILKKNVLKYQRGVALLFALAILSLLMIMAMAFVMNSVFDQKSAYNNASSGNARLLAKSTANRVASLLSFYGDTAAYGDTLNSYVAGGDKDMLDKLTTKVGDSSIFTWNNAKNVTWENIIQNDGVNNRIVGRIAYVVLPVSGLNPNALIASTKKVDESGSVVAAREQRFGITVDEINVRSISPEITQEIATRFNYTAAVAPNTVKGIYTGSNWTSYATFFSTINGTLHLIDSGNMRKKFMQWFMIPAPPVKEECYWIDKNGDGKLDTATERYHRFNLARTATPTWANMSTVTGANGMYANILLDNSGSGTPNILPTAYTAANNDGKGIPWLAFFGYDKNGNIDDAQKGTFSSVVDRRRQIAANLVQYCNATGTAVLTDVTAANWKIYSATNANDPKYTGNKCSPYLNELGVAVTASVTRAAGIVTVGLDGNWFIELINIYPDWTTAASCPLTVTYSYSFKVKVGATTDTITVPYRQFTYTFPAGWANWTPTHGYSKMTNQRFFGSATNAFYNPWTKNYTITPASADAVVSVTDFKLEIDKVVYDAYDCARIKSASSPSTTTSTWTLVNNALTTSAAFTPVNAQMHVSFQTNDPRQNLNPGDWCVTETAPAGMNGTQKIAPAVSDSTLVCTYGAKNKFNGVLVDPAAAGGGKDQETVNDPAYNATTGERLSSAYIRHGVMQSPWELGLIHRGAAWETINLKEYDPNKANKFVNTGAGIIPGGGAYTDPTPPPLTPSGGGDANILDQIKMSNVYTANKININSSYTDPNTNRNIVLQAMLDKIIIGAPPSAPATIGAAPVAPATQPKIGTQININESPVVGHYMDAVTLIASSIMARDKSIDYITRAQVANAMYTVDDVAPPNNVKRALSQAFCGIQDTDAKQEELIGKFINLCDVGGKVEYFTVIILAQSIKDVGGPSTGTGIAVSKKDNNGNVYKFDGITSHGPSVTPAVPPKAKLGTLDTICKTNADGSKTYIYADDVVGEQKVKLFIWRDTSVSPAKSKILSIEYIQ